MNVAALKKVKDLLGGDKFSRCDSMSLRLEKFVRIGGNTKKEEIEEVVRKSSGRIPALNPRGAVSFVAKLGGRLIVNQAGGILENAGLCIHPHYNAPYIPGSAVKGCARHAAWQAWDEMYDGEAKIKIAREIAEIFGYPTGDSKPKKEEDVDSGRIYLDEYLKEKCGYKDEDSHSGKVAFLPAVPETAAKLVVDIVNCHHKDYYGGERPDATDDELPIPNFFPAVKEGTRFTFTLVPCGADCGMMRRVKHWLAVAITGNGVGAKTAAGYGWFEYDEAAEAAAEERRRKDAAEKEEKEKAAAEAARIEAEKEASRAKRASMSVLERWQESGAAAVCGKKGKSFADAFTRADDDAKTEIVRALQSDEGIGAEVWNMIRTDKKRKCQSAVDAVFKWAKDKGLGGMPQ